MKISKKNDPPKMLKKAKYKNKQFKAEESQMFNKQ